MVSWGFNTGFNTPPTPPPHTHANANANPSLHPFLSSPAGSYLGRTDAERAALNERLRALHETMRSDYRCVVDDPPTTHPDLNFWYQA